MSARLSISFFGSSLVSSYWNDTATYYRGLIRALHELGHQVTFYEPDAYERQAHRDIDNPAWAEVVVYPATREGVCRALERAAGADLIIKASGVGAFDELLEREVLLLKDESTQVIFWDVEAPATLERLWNNPSDPFRALVSRYDLILTYGGGDPIVTAYASLGARECIPIYNAVDPENHFPIPPVPRLNADLSFLGNRLPDGEERVDEFFFGTARKISTKKFLLAGSGWDDKPKPANVTSIGHLGATNHNAFNCSPMAVLNITRESVARSGFFPANRIFEAAGAGACIISDRWEGIDNFLEPGREVLVADSGDDVVKIMERLTPHQAALIGARAFVRIRGEHTYAHRARQFQAIFSAGEPMRFALAGGMQ